MIPATATTFQRLVARRDVLRAGVAGVLGWSLPHVLALQAHAVGARPGRAKNVLVVLVPGQVAFDG